ncbi:hypothetical protein ACFL41_01270 [Gemmatimonadota bacterium]
MVTVIEAYEYKRNSVVGDLATKAVEQLIEADAAQNGLHFGTHKERHEYSNASFPSHINKAMRKVWFAYGDLGYDGTNGNRAEAVMQDLALIIDYFEERLNEKIP